MAKKRNVPTGTMFGYNRVLKNADYEAFGVQTRKAWEIHMALKTLRELGAARPGAMLLGVGAARERTIFDLANGNDCAMVFATDLYADMGGWADWAGVDFLKYPGAFKPAGLECEHHRIIPRHADMRKLPFMDDTFDGVFSSGSIEHVGQEGIPDYDAIRNAAEEIARVTKPGGIISLSTEWKIAGNGWGWSHIRLFDADTIMRVIVEPSGCELIDEPDWSFDGELHDALDLDEAIRHPHLQTGSAALSSHGYVFTSVHLALRKPV